EDDGNGEEDQGLRISKEDYCDVNINQGRGLQVSHDVEDSHVTLTLVHPAGQQESSSVSSFVTSMLNPISDAVLQNLPTFDSVFRFHERLKSLEASFSEYRQTNPFAEAFSNIPGIVHQYMNQQMHEAVRVAVQIRTDRLHDSYQKENDEFLKTIDDNMKRLIKEHVKSQVKDQVSRIFPRIKQSVNAQLEYEVLTRSSHSSRTSYAVAADLSEMELKKILIEKTEGNKREDDDDQEGPSAGSDRGSKRRREGGEPESARAPLEPATRSAGRSTTGSKSRQASASESAFVEEPVQNISQIEEPSHSVFETAVQGSAQTWISELVKQADSRSFFNELLDTPIDFSNFIMNRLGVDTLTHELLAGPTYELMRGSCNSLTELEYNLEEVYKATMDQLDWVNPEGQQYPHNLLQPLPLIPDNQGRRVILFAHFINNDLEYLWGGASSQKYTTSVTKTKATDYGPLKWIEDLFYGFAVNRESALDVYSKRRIIAVTDLMIVEWHNYKHLDWISVSRDDDKIYKFKEGDFKRLRLQDIEDMLLLLVQGKLSNLTVEERFAFNVSLRMFTRSIVIQRRVEDLQLGVESYQKRLNLTKPDTYRSDLKRVKHILLIRTQEDLSIKTRTRKTGGEHASASTPSELAIGSAGRSTTGTQSRQLSASESAFAKEPMQTTCQMEEPSHPVFETAAQGNAQSWISALAKKTDARSSFNELLDTPIDFSNFIMNQLGVDTLTPELLAGPTYELMRGSCNSPTELEYHLEEGGASSQKYTTSVTKTKAADYGHIKWIEDLVPRTMWIQEPLNYDNHALWGVSHWGQKRQQFYGLGVYSKRRIIAITDLKIVEWHNYKHLDWISVRRDDDKIYKFKEGDFKRLRLQDIEDMLLLLVQGNLSNLTVEERFAFNVYLRMFTRSIVIQWRVEDL
nr:hypothetical protein [Tanacetum cinerariifolium]